MTITRRQMLQTLTTLTLAPVFVRPASAQSETRVITVAGTGVAGYEPEGSVGIPAIETPINNPYGVVAGPDGALYFCEVDGGRTRRLDLASGHLTTIAGNGESGFSGDGGPALQAAFSAPHEIRFDATGHLYVVERDSHVVRRIDAGSSLVSTLAGTGAPGYGGDGGPAGAAQLNQPHSIAFTAQGDLLICDIGNQRIRVVNQSTGRISTLAGDGSREPTPDTAPLRGTPLRGPRSLDTDPDGNAYLVLREGNAVFKLDLNGGRLERIAGTGVRGYSGDGGPALSATFNGPKGIAYSAADHSLYVVDTENHVIRRMDLNSGTISTVLGTGSVADGPDGDPLACSLARPHGVCVHQGVLYVTDSENHRIRAVSGLL
ncbi:MAG: hypothetical protein RLZZ385_2155 [Pseudomonadota bacterium]|jgi:DNA-binding beta-propeller fold protein YncE